MKTIKRIIGVMLLLCITMHFKVEQVSAQGVVIWDDPVRLSDPNADAGAPALAVDISGAVHVIWGQTTQVETVGEGDTLYYSHYDGENWSTPIDVLVSTSGMRAAQFPELTATPDGMLHVIWTTGGSRSSLVYARVNACCGDDVKQWLAPVLLASPVNAQPHFTSDRVGNLYAAYADSDNGEIYVLHSLDGGDTWSDPVHVAGGIRQPDEYSIYPRLAVGQSGRVHLVWNVLPWPGRSIWYSYSDDHAETWSDPLKIDDISTGKYEEGFGPIVVDVQVRGEKEVHLIWDGAPTVERNHIYSLDDGETWSVPDIVFPEITLSGRAGWNEMAVDGSEILHVVSILGPLHSSWDGKSWSASQDIATRNYLGDGEMMRLRIGLGNQLHVLWLDRNTAPYTVWYVHGITNATPIPSQAIPTPRPTVPAERTQTQVGSQAPPVPSINANGSIEPVDEDNPGGVVFVSAISGLVIITLVGVWIRIKKRS